jgi:predicted TIM-barrel fold metal-dependent hydrolase
MQSLEILDAQVHLFAPPSDRYPWDPGVLADPSLAAMRARYAAHFADATAEAMLAAMDANAVTGALVVSPSVYGYDPAFAVAAYQQHPERFRVIGRVDPERPDVEDLIADWKADPAFLGFRVNLWAPPAIDAFLAGREDRMLAAAERTRFPLCVNAPGRFDLLERIAQRFPALPLVVDHLGLFQMGMLSRDYGDTFAGLDGLLALAAHEQVSVKLTSIPLLSREPYPHADAWPHLHRVIEAFGPKRLMWGSDHTVFEHDYGENINVIRETTELGDEDKRQILGQTLRSVWGWPSQ